MDSLHTGSNELVYIQTDKVSLIIKGRAVHPNFQEAKYSEKDSTFKVFCHEKYELLLQGCAEPSVLSVNNSIYSGIYTVVPLFYEQQRYELIIEATDGHTVAFWHDNLNVRNKVTRASRHHEILSGIINFGNEIGLSDLVIQVDGVNYLRIVVEVFPTKINYQDDYKSIVEDVTKEVCNIVFDLLKKTYLGYQQSDRVNSSPVEFFAVIRKIYTDFLKAIDMILAQPHHMLETTHEVLPNYKINRIDSKTMRWLEKHPEQVVVSNGRILAERALAVKKQVTYDTKENRLAKYILESTAKKLVSFRKNYLHLQREEDQAVIAQIDDMIRNINRRCHTSFLAKISACEASSNMSLVFSMALGYRDLYKYYLMLLRGLSISGDVFNISIKDLALLYEYWCFIKLNSLMKDRYELISQDIIKVQGNGLFVSLVKGRGSKVKYRNPHTGETITLSYNPKKMDVPTVTQKPDNVLTLEKKGASVQYEYVFDAKYRINPALPGSDYYEMISHRPGPEVGDINTMHRYRDAIVYRNGVTPFERTMFGAYVLFPYSNEEEYRNHRFYQSIDKVNIGGLPFLPSATKMVTEMLDELISDSPESAFERAPLPRGIEEKLARIDWSVRDVLVGTLSSTAQLKTCLQHRFYHIPVSRLDENSLPIRYVAIYQSIRLFGRGAGIRYYGEVTKCIPVKRSEIHEIPKKSEDLYYRFEIKEWKELAKPIRPKEKGFFARLLTNIFLLQHSSELPELSIRSEAEYRLYTELKRLANHTTINDEDNELGFKFNNQLIMFENGSIDLYKDGKICGKYGIEEFSRKPNAVFRRIFKDICSNEVE
ncbi:restriction endonuclease-like protein [Desulfitobacterium hafniense]|uniref:restriction endonuclease-like protein n=1 Tax=Desulfitobacterium hafniense TaxID=49338 RepID=UPI00036649CD|nr:restriction endonuclease-like protein [Desulfitobacterium hafniense]